MRRATTTLPRLGIKIWRKVDETFRGRLAESRGIEPQSITFPRYSTPVADHSAVLPNQRHLPVHVPNNPFFRARLIPRATTTNAS